MCCVCQGWRVVMFRFCPHAREYIRCIAVPYSSSFWYMEHHNSITINYFSLLPTGYFYFLNFPVCPKGSSHDASIINCAAQVYCKYFDWLLPNTFNLETQRYIFIRNHKKNPLLLRLYCVLLKLPCVCHSRICSLK